MREIKFRAWQLPNEDLDRKPKMIYDDKETEMAAPFHIGHFGHFSDPGYIFMQNTGLKDKNGKEIYEGDILFNEETEKPMSCFFQNGSFMYSLHDGMSSAIFCHEAPFDIKVIGNIYENPELIAK